MSKRLGICAVVCAAVLVPCGSALATAVPATANIISVEATSGGLTAHFEQVFPVANWDGVLNWALPAPLTLSAAGQTLATVKDLSVTMDADPQVDLSFAITNGSLTDPIMFSVSTATISFGGIPNAQAAATASLTLTQGAGSPAGASLTGLFPNGKAYQARYSTDSVVDTNTVFASLDPSMNFLAGLGMSETEELPWAGMSNLNTTVYMMESQFKFVLSPGDQASGTSAFLIIPEPATLSVLALGALVLGLRRR